MGPVKAIDSTRMRGNFSNHAGDYDSYASVQKRVVELLCNAVHLFALNPGPLLDVGTGTGALASRLSASLAERPLVIVDIAHGMTQEASKRMPAALACDGDAKLLPFAGDCFAAVVSSSVYQWVNCLPTAFADVARVLRPGGLFAVALFGEKTLHELRDSHRQAVNESKPGQASHVQSFPSVDEVSLGISSAGLVARKLFSVMEVEYHSDVPDLLRQLKQIGASNAAADRPRGLASRRVIQAMMKGYEENYRCGAGLPASYEVIIAVAEKPG